MSRSLKRSRRKEVLEEARREIVKTFQEIREVLKRPKHK